VIGRPPCGRLTCTGDHGVVGGLTSTILFIVQDLANFLIYVFLKTCIYGQLQTRGEASILRLRGGLSPGHGERGSASLYRGSGGAAPSDGSGAEPPVGSQGPSPPEAESSVAFEAPAEEPNLTLMTDSFLQFI